MYTITEQKPALDAALKLAKGSYQRDLIRGRFQSWSGSTLKGKAKEWSGSYSQSRKSLVKRLEASNIPHYFYRADHGRITLVLGVW
jgi:hypothetical protein